jgi:hypothetical protein
MEPGEPIFDVPRSCTIYPELVFADRGLGGSMQKLASASGTGVEVVALATFLAKEKLKGSESTFRPYIECLPWDATHPLMWTDDEVELLKGTYAYDEILGFRDQVQTPRPRLHTGHAHTMGERPFLRDPLEIQFPRPRPCADITACATAFRRTSSSSLSLDPSSANPRQLC